MRVPPSSSRAWYRCVCLLSFAIILAASFLLTPAVAQENSQAVAIPVRPLITQALDETHLTVLKGNTHPLARPRI